MADCQTENQHQEPWRDPNAKPYIEIQNVSKKFGDFVAVNDVSLNVYRGELLLATRRIRLRQDDIASHAGRLRGTDIRPHPDRRHR